MTYVCAAGQSAGRASSSTASGDRGAQLVFVCRRRPTPRPLLFLLLRSPGTKITGHVALIQRQGCRCFAWERRRDRKRSRARPALDDDTWARERTAFTYTQAPGRSIGHYNTVLPFCYIQYAHGQVAKRYASSLPRPSPRLPPDGPPIQTLHRPRPSCPRCSIPSPSTSYSGMGTASDRRHPDMQALHSL
jgi:hypothetical protein